MPKALIMEIIWGLKLALNEAVINTGKYGIGIKGIKLETKLMRIMPMYPSSVPNGKRSSMVTN
jgi:hypothetical protein